jgi:3-oxoacyl-[acyl-carrier protein] reductase
MHRRPGVFKKVCPDGCKMRPGVADGALILGNLFNDEPDGRNETMTMKDKLVIVTGAANGIGREIAITFAKAGANLGIVDIDEKNLNLTSQAIEQVGMRSFSSKVDISEGQQIKDFVEAAINRFGKIDVLVNCAALIIYENFLKFDEQVWRRMLDVDLTGYFLFSQTVARKMVEKGLGGRIINIASIAADFGLQRAAAYCSCKAGVIALTKVMALELGPLGINVTAIAPGPIETEQIHSLLTADEIKQRASKTVLERYGRPEDVAKAALFLASDDAQYISGSVLRVDGGASWAMK